MVELMDDGRAGDGPYCAYCHQAGAEYRADPETFDIAEHVKNCLARKENKERENDVR